MPAAIAAVFSAPSAEEPGVPELIALSATYTEGWKFYKVLDIYAIHLSDSNVRQKREVEEKI